MGPFFVQYIVYNLTYPRNVHLSQNSSHNFPHCTECASLSIAEHLPVITSSKPLAKPSRTGFDQLSSNHKPEPAKAAVLASWLAASRAAATLCQSTKGFSPSCEMKSSQENEDKEIFVARPALKKRRAWATKADSTTRAPSAGVQCQLCEKWCNNNFRQFGSSNRELNGTGQERTVLTCSVLFSSWFWLEVVSSVLSSHKEAKNRTELNFGNTTLTLTSCPALTLLRFACSGARLGTYTLSEDAPQIRLRNG
jgi:hypothetical protein